MYTRKTRDKHVSDAFILLALAVGTILGAGIVHTDNAVKAYQSSKFINPLSDKEFIEVEKEVIKYQLPETTEEIICSVFKDNCEEALRIATCESNLRPTARGVNNNGTVDVGLFQINSVHGVSERFLTNPITNTMVAKEIYDGRGNWSAWVCAGKVGL